MAQWALAMAAAASKAPETTSVPLTKAGTYTNSIETNNGRLEPGQGNGMEHTQAQSKGRRQTFCDNSLEGCHATSGLDMPAWRGYIRPNWSKGHSLWVERTEALGETFASSSAATRSTLAPVRVATRETNVLGAAESRYNFDILRILSRFHNKQGVK